MDSGGDIVSGLFWTLGSLEIVRVEMKLIDDGISPQHPGPSVPEWWRKVMVKEQAEAEAALLAKERQHNTSRTGGRS